MKKEMLKRMVALSIALSVIPCGMASAAIEEGTATGTDAIAIGKNSKAEAVDAIAIGSGAVASGDYSLAEGYKAAASKDYAVAEGYFAVASGESAVAIGNNAIASGDYSIAEGCQAQASGSGAIAEGCEAVASGTLSVAEGYQAKASGAGAIAEGYQATASGKLSVAEGYQAVASAENATAIGNGAQATHANSVALGAGSVAAEADSVSVGSGVAPASTSDSTLAPQYRKIINVANGSADHDAATVGQMKTYVDDALANVSGGNVDAYTKTEVDTKLDTKANAATEDARHATFIATATDLDARITAEATARQNAIAQEAITRDAADTRLQSQIDTKADAATEDARHATFIATATDLDARITAEATARQNAVAQESLARWQEDLRLESGIQQNSNAIAGLNQTVTRLDGRLDKVGAGAAALAALHPLDYDAENKLSFAAGLGNYGGATAAAVGAFYRPNQNMMFSIGGTAGNGENMFNVGASFAIGKGSSGVAKLSKAELVQVVKDVKAENSELRHEINNAKADNQKLQERIAKLEEMVLKLAGK